MCLRRCTARIDKNLLFQENVSKSEKTCNELEEKLRITKEEAKRDIELRIHVSDGVSIHSSHKNNKMICFKVVAYGYFIHSWYRELNREHVN